MSNLNKLSGWIQTSLPMGTQENRKLALPTVKTLKLELSVCKEVAVDSDR
jgi:hypothetical protein